MAAPPKGQPPNGNGSEEPRAQTTREAMAAAKSARSQVATYAERASELHPGTSLVLASDQPFWTTHQLAALQHMGVAGASVGDLQVFMHQSVRTQLDPFSGQIHMIKRMTWDNDARAYVPRWTIQTGISGYQVIRDRAARRDKVTVEYEDTVWYDADGSEHSVWLATADDGKARPPSACRVVVLKDGRRFPGVVLYSEVAALKDGKPQAEWRHQPAHMLEKCAEAFALRRAFPRDLSGIYTDEEMGGWDRPEQPPPGRQRKPHGGDAPADGEVLDGDIVGESTSGEPSAAERPKGERQASMAHLHAVLRDLGFGGDALRGARIGICAMLGRASTAGDALELTSTNDLTDEQLQVAITRLEAIKDHAAKSGQTVRDLEAGLRQLAEAGGWQVQDA